MFRTCIIALTLVSFALAQTDLICSGIYSQIGDKCLYVDPYIHATNDQARYFCGNFGGDLVNINSPALYKDIVKYIKGKGYRWIDFWIGGSDLRNRATYGSSGSNYAQEPNKEEVEPIVCQQLDHSRHMRIDELDCDEKIPLICEDLRAVNIGTPA